MWRVEKVSLLESIQILQGPELEQVLGGIKGTPQAIGYMMPASVLFSERTPSTAYNTQKALGLLIQELHQIILTL